MTKKFHEELDMLKAEVLNMGALATCFLEQSVEALVKQDPAAAGKILAIKQRILDEDRRIEQKSLDLLTLHQPMAVDLRLLGSILRVITDLTRIGRYGKDIASLVEELSQKPHVKKLVTIPSMTRMVTGMIRDALDAFGSGELDKVSDIADRDSTVDAQRWEIFRECLSYMIEDPQTITRCMHYIMIARYLERCGDHACSIAEKAHYVHTGKHVELK